MILSHHISLKKNQTHEAKHGLGAKAIRKNAFENECRKTRNKKPQEMERFDEATLAKLWDDCDYSLGKYVGKTQLDADFAKVEEQLGYLLAMAYKALIHQHNDGL